MDIVRVKMMNCQVTVELNLNENCKIEHIGMDGSVNE